MNLRVPLLVRILLWLGLNLVLLGAVFLTLFRVQLPVGLDALLAGRMGARLQSTANLLNAELEQRPEAQWNSVLDRFGEAYGATFALFDADGVQRAGAPTNLPVVVAERLRERRGPRQHAPRPAPPTSAERRQPAGPPSPTVPSEPGRNPSAGRPPRQAARLPPFVAGKFLVRTAEPTRYWAGIRLPIERPGTPPSRLTLFIVSDSLFNGSLFLDLEPWLWTAAGVVALSVLFWIPLVRGITRAITAITRATEAIAQGQFDVRVSSRRRDELGRLSIAINSMAERLGGLVAGQKRFLGDVAHELCSPIARIHVGLGILEQRAAAVDKQAVADVREDVEHMSTLVNDLLSFSKASLAPAAIRLQPVRLRDLAEQAAHREATPPARVIVDVPPGLETMADEELLRRSLANLFRNALRHAGDAGPITCTARQVGDEIELVVADQGPGVPEAALSRLFDAFYRVDQARSRETGGVGLGLAIVKACVEACGGRVTCRNRQPTGLEVILHLKPTPS
jgi:two-component system sensor histidine kinase CpxA